MSWDKARMPRIVLYNAKGEVVIGDNTYIQASSFECKLTDDGKDDVRITFSSKNVALLGGLGLEHGTLVYLSWGYWDSGLCNSIPYIVYDVINTYSFEGLTCEIILTDLASPFDTNGGEPETFEGETVTKDDDGNITSRTLVVSPLDFIKGMMGTNLKFYFMYADKKYLVKDEVVPGNGYIPQGYVWDFKQYDIHGGIFSTRLMELHVQLDDTLWMKDLPQSVQDFLATPRTIDTSPKRHITILERLISVMPEGPWFINRRANVFIIHNRGGFGTAAGQSSLTFNFKSDYDTILSCKIKHDGKKMEDDSIDGADMNSTLRQVAAVQQYNSSITALKDLWLKVKSSAPSHLPSADKSTVAPSLYYGTNAEGKWVTFWGGYELTPEMESEVKAFMASANKYHKYGGVESKDTYYQNERRSYELEGITGIGVDTPKGKNRLTRLSGGHTSAIFTYSSKVTIHNARYTFYSTNPDNGLNNKFIGRSYWQLLPEGDTFWQMSNELKDSASKAITGTLIIKGDQNIREGIMVNLFGIGYDSGTYYVSSVKHTISSTGGYKTELTLSQLPDNGLTQLVQNYQHDIKKYGYDELKEIFQWATFFGIDTRYLWVASGDPSTLTYDEQQRLTKLNREEIMVQDENGKWRKAYRDPSCSDGTMIGKAFDIKYMDKLPDNKTPWQHWQDLQTDSQLKDTNEKKE